MIGMMGKAADVTLEEINELVIWWKKDRYGHLPSP